MKMTPTQWQQLDSIFQTIVDLDSQAREVYLRKHCTDPELRLEVERLLRIDTNNKNTFRAGIFCEAASLLNTERIGEELGSYTLEEELGHGGMGTVYLASRSDEAFNKKVAIKVLHNKLATCEEKKRFKTERQILANMEHANIARLLDGGSCDDGSPFLVMEYVEGDPIDRYGKRNQLSIKEWINLFLQICGAVQYAHRHKVLHCDIKPGNIIVTRDGIPKLVDFGISQLLLPQQKPKVAAVSETPYHAMTPAYASPEQLAGIELDETSDVYTLAIVLRELLTGYDPSHNEDQSIDRSGNNTPKLDYDLRLILVRALHEAQKERYQSVSEFISDLDNYLNNRPIGARNPTIIYRSVKFTQRNPAILLSAALFVAIALLVFNYQKNSQPFNAHQIEQIIRAHTSPSGQKNKLTIAVLPFTTNKNKVLAKRVTEDLIHDLSGVGKFNVIANSTAIQYEPDDIDIGVLDQELNIDNFIQGDIDLGESEIRITIKLHSVANQTIPWQKSYHRPETELNDLQKLVSANIVEAFNLRLSESEHRLLAKNNTTSQAAYEYFSEGLNLYGRRYAQANQLAREKFEKAIALDSKFARAYVVLANTHRADFLNRWSESPDNSIQLANKFIAEALALDRDLAQAHFVKGLIHRDQKQHHEAMASAASAIALNPSYADAFILLASTMCYARMAENSIDLIKKAIRLNPDHPVNYKFHLGQCQYVSGKYDDAIHTFEQAIERNPASQRTNIWLAASYINAGRNEDAEWVVEELLGWNPDLSLKHIKAVTPFAEDSDIDDFQRSLLLAGLPE